MDNLSKAPASGRSSAQGALIATCLSTLVVNANTSAVTILLPSISEDTGSPLSTLQWAVTGYSLVGAACIVTSGALGDVFGRRKVFLGGLALFIVSCVLIALSTSGGGVIAGRCIQGAAGSTILACGLSLLTIATTGAERMRAVSLWGAAAAVGAAAGPLLGGLLVDSTGWQGLFWIDAGVAAVCAVITMRTISESNDPNRPRSIDWLGTVLVAAVLGMLILGVSKGADWGWTSATTLGCFVISAAAGFAFVYAERRSTAPLVDLALVRNAVLMAGTIGILIGSGTINGLMYVTSLYFQNKLTLDFSALEAGLATLPATVALVVLAPIVPKLTTRFSTRTTIAAGFVITTVGFLAMSLVQGDWKYAAFVLPLIAIAAGMALSNGPCSSIATSSVPQEQVGAASGISNMARYVGAAVFTAITAAIYDATPASATADDFATAVSRASLVMALISGAGIAVALLAARHRPPKPQAIDYAQAASAVVHTLPAPHPDDPARVGAGVS